MMRPNETRFSCGRRVARGVPRAKRAPLQTPVTPKAGSCKRLLGDGPYLYSALMPPQVEVSTGTGPQSSPSGGSIKTPPALS